MALLLPLILQFIHTIMQETPRRRSVATDQHFSECGKQGPAGETFSFVTYGEVG